MKIVEGMTIGKVKSIYRQILSQFEKDKPILNVCLCSTFIWGIVCHGYMFLHNCFSHDSLNEFNADVFGNDWKIQLGRILVPYYRKFTRTSLTLPWVIGVLALLWLSITVLFIIKIYKIEKKYIVFLIAGILATNVTVIAMTATYINDLDNNMFALMLSVLAVYFWRKYKYGFCIGALFVGGALGIYQSFISVTITFIIISSILDIFEEKKFCVVFENGIRGILMLLLGGGFYLLLIKLVCAYTKISLVTGKYNSLTNLTQGTIGDYLHCIPGTYKECFTCFLEYPTMFPGNFNNIFQVVIFAIMAIVIFIAWLNSNVGLKEKILVVVLLVVMPIGMNVVYILNKGVTHDLMNYAFWLLYVLALLVVSKFGCKMKREVDCLLQTIVFVVVFVTLWGNVQVSNTVYLKKNIEQEATMSLFTRIMYRVEECEEFSPGHTKIVFIGSPKHLLSPLSGFEVSKNITGANKNYLLGSASRNYYSAYFEYVLQYPDIIADEETWNRMQMAKEIDRMSCYPEEGCISLIENVMLVKIGED